MGKNTLLTADKDTSLNLLPKANISDGIEIIFKPIFIICLQSLCAHTCTHIKDIANVKRAPEDLSS